MKVIEISAGAGARYAGLVLGELGFDVVRLTHPREHLDDDADEMALARHAFFDRYKRWVELDRSEDESLVDELLRAADVVIEDVGASALRRRGLGMRRLRRRPLVSISPYGSDGPRRRWQATELTLQASSGLLRATGLDGAPPRKLPGESMLMIAGLHAATAAVALAFGGARGQAVAHVEISAQEAGLLHWSRHVQQYAFSGRGFAASALRARASRATPAHRTGGYICSRCEPAGRQWRNSWVSVISSAKRCGTPRSARNAGRRSSRGSVRASRSARSTIGLPMPRSAAGHSRRWRAHSR